MKKWGMARMVVEATAHLPRDIRSIARKVGWMQDQRILIKRLIGTCGFLIKIIGHRKNTIVRFVSVIYTIRKATSIIQ